MPTLISMLSVNWPSFRTVSCLLWSSINLCCSEYPSCLQYILWSLDRLLPSSLSEEMYAGGDKSSSSSVSIWQDINGSDSSPSSAHVEVFISILSSWKSEDDSWLSPEQKLLFWLIFCDSVDVTSESEGPGLSNESSALSELVWCFKLLLSLWCTKQQSGRSSA